MDKHQFDKTHQLRVYPIDELDRLEKVPEEYSEPERAAFDEKVCCRCLCHVLRQVTVAEDFELRRAPCSSHLSKSRCTV
jgi:hypothetical protein